MILRMFLMYKNKGMFKILENYWKILDLGVVKS